MASAVKSWAGAGNAKAKTPDGGGNWFDKGETEHERNLRIAKAGTVLADQRKLLEAKVRGLGDEHSDTEHIKQLRASLMKEIADLNNQLRTMK